MALDLVSHHEAAHVLMALRSGGRVLGVSIEGIDDADDLDATGRGGTRVAWSPDAMGRETLALGASRTAMAGPAAEIILTGEVFHPLEVEAWQHDWQEAIIWARGLEVADATRWCEERLKEAIVWLQRDAHWAALGALADQLAAHGALEEEDVLEIVDAWL